MQAMIVLERQLFMTGGVVPVFSAGIMKRYEFNQANSCVVDAMFVIVFKQCWNGKELVHLGIRNEVKADKQYRSNLSHPNSNKQVVAVIIAKNQ